MKPEESPCETTLDAVSGGRVRIYQHTDGYRFTTDAILLAHFLQPASNSTGIDIGTGCGIIPLVLLDRFPQIRRIHGIEIQSGLAELARRNIRLNRQNRRMIIHEGDAGDPSLQAAIGTVDWICANPPFYPPGSGRISPCREKAVANHAFNLSMTDLVRIARQALSPQGTCAVIYPSRSLEDLKKKLTDTGGKIRRIRHVHTKKKHPDKRVMTEFGFPEPGSCTAPLIEKELILYGDEPGRLSPEAAAYYR